ANYFTASERAVPGGGYDYTGFMTSLLKNPDQSTAAYLNVIVSTFVAKYMTDYYQNPLSFVDKVIPTLAAINSSQLGGVVSGLNTLSLALAKDYAAKSMVFNTTMAQVLTNTVGAKTQVFPRVVRNYGPYFDIRSFAQNILNSPEITDLSVRIAANALVEDLKAAVIANTTTTLMYEGLTVLLIPAFYVSGPYADVFTGIETGLSFNAAANWLPLLQDIVHSIPPSSTSSTVVTLTHPGHQLYLSVYNSTGGHTGYNPAIVNFTGWGIETMPGTYYLDFGNGTAFIVLPSSMQSFTTVVDGTAMEEASENYTLTYTVIQNGTVTSTKTVQGIINQDTLQSANVTVQSGFLAVGPTTITGSTASITSSITTTAISTAPTTPSVASTSSTTSTTSSSTSTSFTTPAASSSSAASSSFTTSSSSTGGSLTTVYASVGVAVAIVVVAVAVLARRRAK
ncbi:MAG TPA: clostripain-related cysteine peptidase, partial [Nitrososphaerales archaeon]|nr:clostripain-related cysteine peptidase [Nitrososphaerales archaeon]